MCGRYTLTSSGQDIWEMLEQDVPPSLRPSRNVIEADFVKKRWQISPSSWVPVILPTGYQTAHWWILPSWASPETDFKWRISRKGNKTFAWNPKKRASHFNCRQDTLSDPSKKYWHRLLSSQRCLIPANGFVEWSDEEMLKDGQKKKQALFFMKEHKPYFFAGVYDIAKDDAGGDFTSVNIITTGPNELTAALPHHRMPAILAKKDVKVWMDPKSRNDEVRALLKPTPSEKMDFHFLSPLINKAENDFEEVLKPYSGE